jgi:hypothetical protein
MTLSIDEIEALTEVSQGTSAQTIFDLILAENGVIVGAIGDMKTQAELDTAQIQSYLGQLEDIIENDSYYYPLFVSSMKTQIEDLVNDISNLM